MKSGRKKRIVCKERNWFCIKKPMIEGGNIFKKDTFKFYDYLPTKSTNGRKVDLAFKKRKKATLWLVHLARKGGDHYLVSDKEKGFIHRNGSS